MYPHRINLRVFLRPLLASMVMFALSGCATPNKDREMADLRLRVGTSYLAQGNYPQALRELTQAEQLDPKNAIIQNNLGLTYFLRDRHELAAKHLRRAIELDPAYTEARNNYARVLIELTRYDDAINELRAVTQDLTYTDPAKAWVNLGLAYFRKGNFAQARDSFLEAVKINRNHCLGQSMLGRSFLELSQFDRAATTLDNAVVICQAAKFDEPHYFSGLAYYKLGKTSSAVARMEEVKKLFPDSAYAKKADSLLKLMK